jgi:hypothetical protein
VTKPKPLVALNHFTVPRVALEREPALSMCAMTKPLRPYVAIGFPRLENLPASPFCAPPGLGGKMKTAF